jgi:hypothetical protein
MRVFRGLDVVIMLPKSPRKWDHRERLYSYPR